jgi:hypothetical protein
MKRSLLTYAGIYLHNGLETLGVAFKALAVLT